MTKGIPKHCVYCGKLYTPGSNHSIYCSSICKRKRDNDWLRDKRQNNPKFKEREYKQNMDRWRYRYYNEPGFKEEWNKKTNIWRKKPDVKKRIGNKLREQKRVLYDKNRKEIRSRDRFRYKTDINYREYKHNHCKEYRQTINGRLAHNISSRIRNALIRGSKSGKTEELISCSIQELRVYIENMLKPGMSWDNYGKWHIDHIIPCASFDLSNPEEQKKCFHYSNLQPLWAKENMSKNRFRKYV